MGPDPAHYSFDDINDMPFYNSAFCAAEARGPVASETAYPTGDSGRAIICFSAVSAELRENLVAVLQAQVPCSNAPLLAIARLAEA